jgi:hypothetical protein
MLSATREARARRVNAARSPRSPRSPRPPHAARLRRVLCRLALLAPAALALLAGAGCGHAQSFDAGVLHKDGVTVRIGPVPPGWRRIEVDGADLTFRDDERSGSALFNVRCGQRDDDAPLAVLTDHLIMGTTEREFDAQDTVPFDGREALHTLLRAKLDGVPMQYDIYVMKKDGCLYDLVYVAPPARFADGAADFERFAAGVRTEGSPSVSSAGAAAAATSARDP